MKYLVIDTEGTGVFKFKDEKTGNPIPADAPGQPRLASLTMLFADEMMELEREEHFLIKPDGWEMPPEAEAVNKLATAYLLANGKPVKVALDAYTAAIKEGRVVVAHHAQHDCKQMRAELRRAGMPDLFNETPNVCTQRSLMGIVKKLDGKGGWPKLSDCCAHFDVAPGDHTSGGDALAVLLVARAMLKAGMLRDGKVHYAATGAAKKKAKLRAAAERPLRDQLEDSVAQDVIDGDSAAAESRLQGKGRGRRQLSDGDEF